MGVRHNFYQIGTFYLWIYNCSYCSLINSFQANSNSSIPKRKTKKGGRESWHVKKKETTHLTSDVVDGDEDWTRKVSWRGTVCTPPLCVLVFECFLIFQHKNNGFEKNEHRNWYNLKLQCEMRLWCMQCVISPEECKNINKSNLIVGIGRYIFRVALPTIQG